MKFLSEIPQNKNRMIASLIHNSTAAHIFECICELIFAFFAFSIFKLSTHNSVYNKPLKQLFHSIFTLNEFYMRISFYSKKKRYQSCPDVLKPNKVLKCFK